MRGSIALLPACLASVSLKFFEMETEHAEAHLLGVTTKVLREFKDFEANFEKSYEREERKIRAQVFQQNYLAIEQHNGNQQRTWTMGVNEVEKLNVNKFVNIVEKNVSSEIFIACRFNV